MHFNEASFVAQCTGELCWLSGELPQDGKRARKLILSRSQFELLKGSLYRINPDKTLRVIPPTTDQQNLFLEVHQGVFSGHFREAKIHSQLSQQYWWPGMRKHIADWCRACLTCAFRNIGAPVRPPLTPIPVGGPFDRVGVDVLQLPKTKRGYKYVATFLHV